MRQLYDAAAAAHQWYRGTTAITGATSPKYTPTRRDAGRYLTVKVTARRSGYSTASTTSTKVGIPMVATTAPTLTGTAKAGKTLTISPGTWTVTPSRYTYQWLRNGKAITGKTGTTYPLTSKDKGTSITAKVTATRPGYVTGTATTKARTIVR